MQACTLNAFVDEGAAKEAESDAQRKLLAEPPVPMRVIRLQLERIAKRKKRVDESTNKRMWLQRRRRGEIRQQTE